MSLKLIIYLGETQKIPIYEEAREKITIYGEARKKIEAITRKGDLLVLKIAIPLYIIPTMIQSYFQYYRMDYGKESFRLPLRAS